MADGETPERPNVGIVNLTKGPPPGEYVVITREAWISIQGELLVRPVLLNHIGPIKTWTLNLTLADD